MASRIDKQRGRGSGRGILRWLLVTIVICCVSVTTYHCLLPLTLKMLHQHIILQTTGKVNHLLFTDHLLYTSNEKSLKSLIQTARVFSDDIGMEFEVKKCAV